MHSATYTDVSAFPQTLYKFTASGLKKYSYATKKMKKIAT